MISVITPSYQQGQYIERTIQSVLSQQIPSLEYVVIDGGSQDETLTILKNYASRLHFVSEKDRGQAHAVNKGLAMTRGDIIGWLNSDDIYYPETLKMIEDFFATHPDVDVIYGQANYIDEHDVVLQPYETEVWDIERLKQICFLAQPAVFFRRRVVEKVGMLQEELNFCMDYEFWLRAALQGVKFAFLPRVLAGYRLHSDTKTVSKAAVAQLEAIKMLRKKLGYVPVNWLLYYAVTTVQNKTTLRMPQWRYIVALMSVGVWAGLRWNGWKGLKGMIEVPQAMLRLHRRRQS